MKPLPATEDAVDLGCKCKLLYGRDIEDTVIVSKSCPLHGHHTEDYEYWEEPSVTRDKGLAPD